MHRAALVMETLCVVILIVIIATVAVADPPRSPAQTSVVLPVTASIGLGSPTETSARPPSRGTAAHDTPGRVAVLPSDPETLRGRSPVIHGQATWYDGPAGQAAAGPGLRRALGSGWRGSRVDVCRSGVTWISCVRVTLSDWCACSGERIIDLDDRTFAQLAPLSKGVIRVRVALGSPPRETITQPPTDTAP